MTKDVNREEWNKALAAHRADEKRMTRAMDDLSAKRRRLPRLEVTGSYRFKTDEGVTDLPGLFEGRRQLIVYHHMLKPGDTSPCSGCSMVADQIVHLAHLNARDTTFTMVSKAPLDEITAFKARMGWTLPWVETLDDFGPDFDVTTGFGVNVFLRDRDHIWRTYFTTSRGVEMLGTVWSLLDITPYGRQETWQAAPDGTPQTEPYRWWRLHDQYGDVRV